MRIRRLLLLLALTSLAMRTFAHDPLNDLPAPTSPGEAWNVINQSLANVQKCLDSNQARPWREPKWQAFAERMSISGRES